MEPKKWLLLNVKSFSRFVKMLLSNRKAAFGTIIIVAFIIVSLFPNLFTSCTPLGKDPETGLQVAFRFCVPSWLRYIPSALGGNPHLTEDFTATKDPGLPSIGEGGEFKFETDASGIVSARVDSSFGYPFRLPIKNYVEKNGSLAITFSRPTGTVYNETKAYLLKEFYYPYSGYPADFECNVELLVDGTTHAFYLDVPVKVRVFMGSSGGERWSLWPPVYNREAQLQGALDALVGFTVNTTTGDISIATPKSGRPQSDYWIISRPSRESGRSYIGDGALSRLTMGLTVDKTSIPYIFVSSPGNYTYGIEITFIDTGFDDKQVSTTVYVDDFNLHIYGNSYGVMGTDHEGNDLFAQLIYGTRISLSLGLAVSIMTVAIGLIVGLAAGYLGGVPDQLLMRFNDLMLCLPTLPLLIVLAAVLGHSVENLMIIMTFLGWNGFARVVRSMTLSIKERPFVEAARAVGAGSGYVIWRHIVPNVMSVVYVSLATSVPGAVTYEAALSWLGFYDPSRMSWGRMLNNLSFQGGAAQAAANPLWPILPGLLIALLASSFILLGYALDEILNPKLRLRR